MEEVHCQMLFIGDATKYLLGFPWTMDPPAFHL